MSGPKTPKVKAPPKVQKKPKVGDVDVAAARDRRLSWRLSGVDFHGPWGWNKLTDAELPQLHRQLLDYERETLAALRTGKRIQPIPAEDLCSEAQTRLIDQKRDDAELWELRLGYKKWRAWGVLTDAVFYFLWWDPEHTVCGPPQKGTARRSR